MDRFLDLIWGNYKYFWLNTGFLRKEVHIIGIEFYVTRSPYSKKYTLGVTVG